MGISGVLSNVHSWSCKSFTDKNGQEWAGGQVDMLIDRSDNVINFCEMKYVSDKYSITADYDERLRQRASLFKQVTKTRKSIQYIFVTTYGIANNKYSGIAQNSITLDDLFV